MYPRPAVFAFWAWLFTILGVTISILGPAIPAQRAEFLVPLGAAGLVFSAHSAGYLSGVFIAGTLGDIGGLQRIGAAGVVTLALGMALGGLAPAWGWLLAAMVVAGFGFAFIDVALNAAIGNAVEGAGKRALMMNILHGAFPAGTLVAPGGLALIWTFGLGWREAYLIAAAATGASLAGFAFRSLEWRGRSPSQSPSSSFGPNFASTLVPNFASTLEPPASSAPELSPSAALVLPAPPEPATPGITVSAGRSVLGRLVDVFLRLARLLREADLRRLAVLQCLYVGVELGVAGWLATYLVDEFGASESAAALGTAAYWSGFLVGRPIMGVLAHRLGPRVVLFWMLVVGVIAAAAGMVAPGPYWAVGAYTLCGVAVCGVFPTVMALALEGRRGDMASVTALIVAAAAVGGLIWPWLIGVVAQQAGIRAAMLVVVAPLLAMLVVARSINTPEAGPANRTDRESRPPHEPVLAAHEVGV